MLRLVTTADTEILATASAIATLPPGFPEVRCANPAGAADPAALVEALLDGARVVVCRILGGRRGWPEGFELLRAGCQRRGVALIALGGEAEPDAELTGLSLAPPGAVAQAGEYLRHGDVANVAQLLRFLADTFLLEGYGFEPPRELPDLGVYLPGAGDVPLQEALAGHDPGRPTVGIAFYRSHALTGNTAFVDELCAAIERGRRQRAGGLELHAAPRPRRGGAGARPGARPRRRAGDHHARHRRLRRGRRAGAGRRGRRRGLAGVGRPRPGRARRAGDPGRLRHLDPGRLGGLGPGPRPARRRHPGGHPRVRRARDGRRDLVQGARRGRLAGGDAGRALRPRPGAVRPRGRPDRALGAPARHAGGRAPRGHAAHELPHPPRPGRQRGRARHTGQRPGAARRTGRRGDAGRPPLRDRRRADARADRRRRPRPGAPDRRPAGGLPAAHAGRRLPGLVRDPPRHPARGDGAALGPAARRALRRRRRARDRRPGARQRARSRSSPRAAGATTR